MVGQFAVKGPPIKVIRSVVNWLWGYEGKVEVSQMDTDCYLFEFALEALCEWVLQRSWHIHKAPMVTRRWFPGIQPIDFSKDLRPVWIELKGVPAEMITLEGISWLATQFGKPVNKFVRLGFTIKACVLRSTKLREVSELRLDMGDEEPAVVRVVYPSGRTYGTARRWDARQKSEAPISSAAGNMPKPSEEGEGSPAATGGSPVGGGLAMFLSLQKEGRKHQTNRMTPNLLRRSKS
ncbi:hypothetical protein LINPERPRIM_LOCUS20835 [Linum perenne]